MNINSDKKEYKREYKRDNRRELDIPVVCAVFPGAPPGLSATRIDADATYAAWPATMANDAQRTELEDGMVRIFCRRPVTLKLERVYDCFRVPGMYLVPRDECLRGGKTGPNSC